MIELISSDAPEAINTPIIDPVDAPVQASADAAEAPAVPAGPNGFELLGLAPELVSAVAEMGFVQPTAVQINEFYYENVEPGDVGAIIDRLRAEAERGDVKAGEG